MKKPARKNNQAKDFTATEVGALVEGLHKEIRLAAEDHERLEKGVERVEIAVSGNSRRLDRLEMGSQIVNDKLHRIEDGMLKLSKDLRETREELGETREELNGKIETVRRE